MPHIRRNKLNTYQLENLSVVAHQSETYVWSQDRNHFCAALSEIHTLLSAYNMQAWNLSKNALNNMQDKIHLRTDHEAQNGSNALSLTSVLYGEWVVNTTPWSLYQWARDLASIVQDAGWDPGWSGWVQKISSHWDSIPGPSSLQWVAILTELSWCNFILITGARCCTELKIWLASVVLVSFSPRDYMLA